MVDSIPARSTGELCMLHHGYFPQGACQVQAPKLWPVGLQKHTAGPIGSTLSWSWTSCFTTMSICQRYVPQILLASAWLHLELMGVSLLHYRPSTSPMHQAGSSWHCTCKPRSGCMEAPTVWL